MATRTAPDPLEQSLRREMAGAVRPARVDQRVTRQKHLRAYVRETAIVFGPGALALWSIQRLPWMLEHTAPVAHLIGFQG